MRLGDDGRHATASEIAAARRARAAGRGASSRRRQPRSRRDAQSRRARTTSTRSARCGCSPSCGAQRRAGTSDPVVLVVGSAEQYGRHEPTRCRSHEEAEQRPLTLYAASKAAQEVAALQAFRSEGVRVVCTRSFNHSGVGPRRSSFLLPAPRARARSRCAPTRRDAADRQRRHGARLSARRATWSTRILRCSSTGAPARRTTSAAATASACASSRRRLAARRCLRRHFDRSGARLGPSTCPCLRRRSTAKLSSRDTGLDPPSHARRHHRRPDSCRDALTSIAFSSSAPARSSSGRPPSSTTRERRPRRRCGRRGTRSSSSTRTRRRS